VLLALGQPWNPGALAADAEPGGATGHLVAPPRPLLPGNLPSASGEAEAEMYDRCLSLAKTDPQAAYDLAQSWQLRGGAHPADHCFAVALVGLRQYKEGAARLEKLQHEMVHAPTSLRAQVLGQAAQAWLLAGDTGKAYKADTGALALRPDDTDLLLDRAQAAGAAKWYDKAIADLDKVLKADPSRVDALVFRASANRALNRLDPALADIDKAVSIAPTSSEALLERGYVRAMRGDGAGAVQDWEKVIAVAPDTADASTAHANLARLNAAAANEEGMEKKRRKKK